jgi:nicotinic acid mononucleotide adenylyltransferase
MCRLVVAQSSWIDVSSYEAESAGFINFPRVARHHAEYLRTNVKQRDIALMYLGGADLIAKCGLIFGISAGKRTIPVVGVARPGHTKELKEMVETAAKHATKEGRPTPAGCLYVVLQETSPISSTEVRKLLEQGKSVAPLCGEQVEAYLNRHNLHAFF